MRNLVDDVVAAPPPTPEFVDLMRFDDAILEYFIPALSFKDLANLERTCSGVRDELRKREWWRLKLEHELRTNPQAERLFHRYATRMRPHNPKYYRRAGNKLGYDLAMVKVHIRNAQFRMARLAVRLSHGRAWGYALSPNCDYLFVTRQQRIELYNIGLSPKRFNVEFHHEKTMTSLEFSPSPWARLLISGDWIVYVTVVNVFRWNWRTGVQQPIEGFRGDAAKGLGWIDACMFRGNHIIVATSDNEPNRPRFDQASGAAECSIWTLDPDLNVSRAPMVYRERGPREERQLNTCWPTNISIDLDGHMLVMGFAFIGSTIRENIHNGKCVIYDLRTESSVYEYRFNGCPIFAVSIHAGKGLVMVVAGDQLPWSRDPFDVRIINMRNGQTVRSLRQQVEGVRNWVWWRRRLKPVTCMATDWESFVFVGGKNHSLEVYDLENPVNNQRSIRLGGHNGLPLYDDIHSLTFDGCHLFLNTRGSWKRSLRCLDFLCLRSLKF